MNDQKKSLLKTFIKFSPEQSSSLFEFLHEKRLSLLDSGTVKDMAISTEDKKDRLYAESMAAELIMDIIMELENMKRDDSESEIFTSIDDRLEDFR
jgi:hypothetical protein